MSADDVALEKRRQAQARHNAAHKKQHRTNPLVRMVIAAKHRRPEGFDLRSTDLTVPEFCPIPCFGVGLASIRFLSGRIIGGSPRTPSLDRIDNEIGYTKDNCVVISDRLNRIKRDGTAAEHRSIAAFMDHRGDVFAHVAEAIMTDRRLTRPWLFGDDWEPLQPNDAGVIEVNCTAEELAAWIGN